MKKTILIAAVMFLAFSVAASAQGLLQVGSTPVTTAASCGTTELTGDVQFSLATNSNPLVTGTITINYGVPIYNVLGVINTSTWSVNGLGPGSAAGIIVPISTISDLLAGKLILQINPAASVPPVTTFDVNNVRVNIAGNPTLTDLKATVTAGLPQIPGQPVNSFLGGQTSVVVISSIGSAIGSVSVFQPLTTTSVSPIASNPTVIVTEGFLNAWVQNALIKVTFTGVPAGVSLDFPATLSTVTPSLDGLSFIPVSATTLVDATGVALTATQKKITSTGAAITVYYQITTPGANAAGILEQLRLQPTVAFGAGAPFALGTATVTADIVGISATVPVPPQYSGATCQKGPADYIKIITATTNLLIPYATTAVGYDVGLAIANTTADPFTPSAPDQDGSITFYFFPSGGTPFNWSPTGSTGGLTDGKLKAGNSFIYLLSQLLADAGKPATFNGYIFVICNFTNGHGQYFVSDFKAFTNGALMLVVPTRPANPETLMH